MDNDDLARYVETVLMTLADVTDRHHLKVMLPIDHQIVVLAAAIMALNNVRHDAPLFRPVFAG